MEMSTSSHLESEESYTLNAMSTSSHLESEESYTLNAMSPNNPEESSLNGDVPEGSSAASDSIFAQGDFDRSLHPQPIAFSTPKRRLPVSLSSAAFELESMDNSELRTTLLALMEETESLKKEVEIKDKLISQVQFQVKSLLDKEFNRSFATAAFPPGKSSNISSSFFQDEIQRSFEASRRHRRSLEKDTLHFDPQEESSRDLLCIPEESEDLEIISNNMQSIPSIRGGGMIPETTLVLIREMTNFINLGDVTLNRERVQEALHVSGQVCVGLTVGWASAFFLKNFGKAAVTALGGGGLIIAYAQHKGYIHINWSEIFQQLDNANTSSSDNSHLSSSSSSSSSWTAEQIRTGREWVSNHSIPAGSFLVSFLYNLI